MIELSTTIEFTFFKFLPELTFFMYITLFFFFCSIYFTTKSFLSVYMYLLLG